MLLIILQNAYTTLPKLPPYDVWLATALWNSPTGIGLIKMLPEGIPYFIINSTDEVADNSRDVLKPNPHWIRKWIKLVKPRIVLACGKVAQRACTELQIDHVKAPHPAWTGLTKEKIEQVKTLIAENYRELEK
jgi:hypothetical protein